MPLARPYLPEGYTESTWRDLLHRKAHDAMLLELQSFDWMSIDRQTALEIHALIAPKPLPRKGPQRVTTLHR